jgi:hypothetical protein
LAGKVKSREMGQMVEEISEPASEHNKSSLGSVAMIAGGLGLGVGIAYLVDPDWAGEKTRQLLDRIRSTARFAEPDEQAAVEESLP